MADFQQISLKLPEVLGDIGVTEEMVNMRKNSRLIYEALHNLQWCLKWKNSRLFVFGSQIEGTTTIGLKSDIDVLACAEEPIVIQSLEEWQVGKSQYLMVTDESTSPGHCLLQLVSSDAPVLAENCKDKQDHGVDDKGRVLLNHSFAVSVKEDHGRHGPANTAVDDSENNSYDYVRALVFHSWPRQAKKWLQQEGTKHWPSTELIHSSAKGVCFAVAAASKNSNHPDFEWRISTSHAERSLMHSLNITQIRCYILMKMILKTYLNAQFEDVISSYICKTVLFHCISDSRPSDWEENQLLERLVKTLQALCKCIERESCPHFIVPENNLLLGKLSADTKQQLAVILIKLEENIGETIVGISVDNLGDRLSEKIGGQKSALMAFESRMELKHLISAHLVYSLTILLRKILHEVLKSLHKFSEEGYDKPLLFLHMLVKKVIEIHKKFHNAGTVALNLFVPFLMTYVGSFAAARELENSMKISKATSNFFLKGLHSDLTSSQVKSLSVSFRVGIVSNFFLTQLKRIETLPSLTMCFCHSRSSKIIPKKFHQLFYEKRENAIQRNLAFCVIFLPLEKRCCALELEYEMYRSTRDELRSRKKNYWMDWAVVDSMPYYYFLKYKVYSQLFHNKEDKLAALQQLARTIDTDPYLGHRETAWNLFGQCLEQENRKGDALHCYIASLKLRPRHNAARWHICRLLAGVVK